MTPSRSILTEADVRSLVRGADVDRAEAAYKICRRIGDRRLSPEDRKAAQDILRLMAADAAEAVRRALAETLKSSRLLPRDVAMQLARDVENVAVPVLNFSPAFTDGDLAEIVRVSSRAKQIAVARRAVIAEPVAATLAEYGVEDAVRVACANDNAAFSESSLQRLLDRFPGSEGVRTAMVYRTMLPPTVSERLVRMAGGALREHLISHHGVAPAAAAVLTAEAVGQAMRQLAGPPAPRDAAVAAELTADGLSASVLLRALAHGEMHFFELGVAELSGVPPHRARMMIHDGGPLGLRAIYERAGLPVRLFPAFRAGVDVYREVELEGGRHDRERFRERVVQRVLAQHQGASRDDLRHLLERLDEAAGSAAARASAA